MDKINEFRDEHFYLSNFFGCPVVYLGISYRNNEAAFQAMKCNNPEDRKSFSNLSPSQAKYKGRRVKLRSDWESVKDQIMYEIVLAKFEQNRGLAFKLMNTGEAHLEEGNTWGDRIWGTVNGVGQNKLGKTLMRVRNELKEVTNG